MQSMSTTLESSAFSYLFSNQSDSNEGSPGQNSKRSCAVNLTVSKPQSLVGENSGAHSPFVGWQSTGSLCRAQLAAEGPVVGRGQPRWSPDLVLPS